MRLHNLIFTPILLICVGLNSSFAQTTQIPIRDQVNTAPSAAPAYDFQVPQQVLDVPSTVEAGEDVDCKVKFVGNSPAYLAAVSYKWKVLHSGKDKKFREGRDDSSISFAAGIYSKNFDIIVSCTYLYIVKDDKQTILAIGQRSQILMGTVQVHGINPGPGPGPAPVPPPSPIPPGKYGLGRTSYELGMKDISAGPSRQQGALAIANSMRGISSSVKAGAIKDVKALLQQTQASNRSALQRANLPIGEWDRFFTDLQGVIYDQFYSNGKLQSVNDFADAWLEIADGLEKVQ